MYAGKSLIELARELDAQSKARNDYVADTREISMSSDMRLQVANHGPFVASPHTHRQIASRLQIPQKYYDRLQDKHPDILANDVSELFHREPERRMVRTMHGNARAFLSDRYRLMDNPELANAVLPVLMEVPDLQIMSADITETRMYIKAVFPRQQTDLKVGDPVQAGIVVSNSEIGLGALHVDPLIFRLVCLNGMIAASSGTKKYHAGRVWGSSEEAYEIFQDDTLKADDDALWRKVRDIVRAAALDVEAFRGIVDRVRETTDRKIANPMKAVEVVSNQFRLTDGESNSVLMHLIQGGDLTQYGVMNAVTRASQDASNYDRATEMERMGGQIVDLNKSQWRAVAEAA